VHLDRGTGLHPAPGVAGTRKARRTTWASLARTNQLAPTHKRQTRRQKIFDVASPGPLTDGLWPHSLGAGPPRGRADGAALSNSTAPPAREIPTRDFRGLIDQTNSANTREPHVPGGHTPNSLLQKIDETNPLGSENTGKRKTGSSPSPILFNQSFEDSFVESAGSARARIVSPRPFNGEAPAPAPGSPTRNVTSGRKNTSLGRFLSGPGRIVRGETRRNQRPVRKGPRKRAYHYRRGSRRVMVHVGRTTGHDAATPRGPTVPGAGRAPAPSRGSGKKPPRNPPSNPRPSPGRAKPRGPTGQFSYTGGRMSSSSVRARVGPEFFRRVPAQGRGP